MSMHLRLIPLVLAFVVAAGCAHTSDPNATAAIEPRLGPGFDLPVGVRRSDFPELARFAQESLAARWEDSFEFSDPVGNGPLRSVTTCVELLAEDLSLDSVVPMHDWNVVQARDRVCRAAQVMSGAEQAKSTLWPDRILTPSAPEQLPAEVVWRISGDQELAFQQGLSVGRTRWSEHEAVLGLEMGSDDGIAFLSENQTHYLLAVVARADFTGDGEEDVLLRVLASPYGGGSMVSHRLFLLGIWDGAWRVRETWDTRH